MNQELKREDVILVHRGAIGNARSFRMRVEQIKATETRRSGIFVSVYGVEVTRTGETRRYFGNKYSEFSAWLGPDDYEVIAVRS